MTEHYLVRCTADPRAKGRLVGIFAAGLTITGMISTWKPGRARRFDTESAATDVASRLGKKFAGTTWTVEPADVAQ